VHREAKERRTRLPPRLPLSGVASGCGVRWCDDRISLAADRAVRLATLCCLSGLVCPAWTVFRFGFSGATTIGSSGCEFCAAGRSWRPKTG